jgi:hypothetical protein
MIKYVLAGLLAIFLGLTFGVGKAQAYDYGYMRLTNGDTTCNSVTIHTMSSNGTTPATRVNLSAIIYLQDPDGSNQTYVRTVTSSSTTSSSYKITSSSLGVTCGDTVSGRSDLQIWVEAELANGHVLNNMLDYDLNSTSGNSDDLHIYLLDSASPTQTITSPASLSRLASLSNIQRKLYVTLRAPSTRINYLYDHGIQYCTLGQVACLGPTASWLETNVGTAEVGHHGSSANLPAGTVTRPTVSITTPSSVMDGTMMRWLVETLDQSPPNYLNIWGADESKYWTNFSGPSYFFMTADLRAESLASSGSLTAGSSVSFSVSIKNYASGITARASKSQLQITRDSDGTAVYTKDASTNQLGSSASVINAYGSWIAQPGDYTAQVCADYLDVVMESSDTNNCTSIAINIPSADLQPLSLVTTKSNGAQKRVFDRNEAIYANVRISNANSTAATAFKTQVYANQPSTVAVGTLSDITPSGMYISHSSLPGSSSAYFGSYAGGSNNSAYQGQKSWSVSASTGVLSARAYVNFDQSASETNYTNNQLATKYGVVVPPVPATVNVSGCGQAGFSWTASAGANNYVVRITRTDTSATTEDTTASTSLNKNLGEGPHNYQWWVIPQVLIDGTYYPGNAVDGGTFTTTACPEFELSAPSPVTINPGGTTPATENLTVTYKPTDSFWNATTDTMTLVVRDLRSGAFDCSTIDPIQGPAHSGSIDSGNITVTMSNGTSTITVPALTKQISISIAANAAATLGTYTLCVAGWSNNSATPQMANSIVVNVEMAAWLQVGGQAAGAQGAGDVHSNGSIGNIIIPSNPIQQYFFVTSSIGVVSSSSTLGLNPLTRLSSLAANDWLWTNYPSPSEPIKTSVYSGLLSNAGRTATPTELPAGQNLQLDNSCGASGTYHVAGNAVLDNGTGDTSIEFPASCDGVNRMFFIDGNLNVHDNVVDQTKSGTLTFVVGGDIVLDASVSQLDGVYMFGGHFDDGAGSTRLVVHGSLLGLAGSSPSSGTGSFTSSGGTTGLQRNLGAAANATQPAELIYYQPKYVYLLRDSSLGGSTFSWTE